MHTGFENSPALTVALALAAGIVAQSVARHLRVPGIVVLIGVGVTLGPDILGILDPHGLGNGLEILVQFAVAVILFEGGLNLDWRRLRHEAATIRRFVLLGALITAVGGTLCVRWILGWEWPLSILFGTLVIVTGPTVITPLLRRIRLKRNVETILEAEGVFIDAVGAIIAVVALEVVVNPSGSSIALGFVGVPSKLVSGALIGLIGGFLVAFLLRFRGVVPEGLENVFTLSLVFALFQVSDLIVPESGISTVITAGLVLGNKKTTVDRELKEFKEQLTVLLIGMLFVLLAADTRLDDVSALGWRGFAVVIALMVVIRPLNVIACTFRTGMKWQDRTFLAWLAPRGIVAAAIASLFHDRLLSAGLEGGDEMRALVFMVISLTVIVQGSTGGLVASMLKLKRPSNVGYVILGANRLSRVFGKLLRDAGDEVVLIDASSERCKQAELEGFRVVFGNGLDERVLLNADIESRKGAIAVLANEAVSLLFARKAKDECKVAKAYVALDRGHGAIDADMIHEVGASVLFRLEIDIDMWSLLLRRGLAEVQVWRFGVPPTTSVEQSDEPNPVDPLGLDRDVKQYLLPLACRREGVVSPLDDRTRVTKDDEVFWLVHNERAETQSWLDSHGWTRVMDRRGEETSPA